MRLADPGVARRAAVLVALAPSCVLFTATSMDGPFAVSLLATMWLFWESLERRAWLFGSLAGLAATAAALMTYSVTVAILFCGVAACVTWLAEPAGRARVAAACASALGAFVLSHVVVWLATGFDPIAMFRVAVAHSNQIMAGTRHESIARYAHLVVANLVVFFVAAGLASCVLWWPAAARAARDLCRTRSVMSTTGRLSRFTIAAVVTLIVAACVPVYVLEVERVWMFLVPLIAIPAAARLAELERGSGRLTLTLAVAALLAAQTLLTEVLLTTYW
jgi:hypothetical protein